MNRDTVLLPPADSELARLVELMCDGAITSAERDRLESLLAGNRDAKLFYVAYLDLHAQMQWMMRDESGEQPVKDAWTDQAGISVGIDSPPSTQHSSALPLPPVIIQTLPSAVSPLPSFIGSALFSYIAALVIVALGLTIGARVHVAQPDQIAAPHDSVPTLHSKSLMPNPSTIVGRITGMADCQWADPSTQAINGAYVRLNRKYALASGLMEITYDTGAKVVLQGPVTYEVESPAGGYLSVGRLTARLEKKSEVRGQRAEPADQKSEIASRKFVVRTPTALVTDLGTEFGVEVSRDGVTEAHIFSGRVTLAPWGQDRAEGTPQLLQAGSAGRVGGVNHRVSTIAINEKQFVRRLALPRPATGSDYAEMVLALRPVVYYRMEPLPDDKTRLVDSASGGHHGLVAVDKAFQHPARTPGHYGDALSLRGAMVHDYAIVADYPKSEDGRLTVSAWIWSGPFNSEFWPAIVANWGHAVNGQFHLGLCATDLDLEASICDPDGNLIWAREGSDRPLPQQIWQHAAFTFDGKTIQLYRNGQLVAERECNGMRTKTPIRSLTIGCNANDAGDSGDSSHFWQGRIDEVAVFNRVLPADAIRQLYEGPTDQRKQTIPDDESDRSANEHATTKAAPVE